MGTMYFKKKIKRIILQNQFLKKKFKNQADSSTKSNFPKKKFKNQADSSTFF